MVRWLLVSVVCFSLQMTHVVIADDGDTWHQWRGPTRDAKTQGKSWPDDLKSLKTSWNVPLQPSYSGPIVTKDRIFVTETVDQRDERVSALDRNTGKEIWSTSWKGAISVPFFAKANGDWIRSTPAYDGSNLYVAGIRDVLVCLDGETGDEVWKFDFAKQLGSPVPSFGCASSPLIIDDAVYIQAGGAFVKLDKRNGAVLWRSLQDGGGMSSGAFSSPTLATLQGSQQLLVQTRTSLTGVSPETGEVLWKVDVPAFRGMNILTPLVSGDKVFTSTYGGQSFMFHPKLEGIKWSISEHWSNKLQGYMSSPVIVNDYIYLHLRNQRFTCIKAETGEIVWTTKPYGKYWSMVSNGDKILALDERGEALLIRANPEQFELLDSKKLSSDSTWAHIAMCNGEVFVRGLRSMETLQWTNESIGD